MVHQFTFRFFIQLLHFVNYNSNNKTFKDFNSMKDIKIQNDLNYWDEILALYPLEIFELLLDTKIYLFDLIDIPKKGMC